jgi:hypothetical protein
MHHKNIKLIIRKQLKKQYPNWKRLSKKQKRAIAKAVLNEAIAEYDFEQDIQVPLEELIGIEEQSPTNGIMNLEEMTHFVDVFTSSKLRRFNSYDRSKLYLKDEELKFINDLLDDGIVNRLLSYDGYSPCMRDIFPCNLLRAELLKAIKYPEISYRKLCGNDYLGMDMKQNRVFVGLPLISPTMIHHSELSKFRSSLTFSQLVNVMTYILHHFYRSGLLGDCVIHGIDSTELANECKTPLASIEVNGKKIRIYNDLDCDCGKRRNKRDKSPYVIGYRLHTLTAINAETGHSYPLISLLAPANHHDSNFLLPLVKLAQAIGIDMKLVTADEAYHDGNGAFHEETGVHLTTPPSAKVALPEHVDPDTLAVFIDDMCEIPMCHVGYENHTHEYKCGAAPGECLRSGTCPQFREVSCDKGNFQRIPNDKDQVEHAHAIRKNIERPFNLLKNQTGLEQVRVRSQHSLIARSIFSNIGVLLLAMAGTRKKKQVNKPQQMNFDLAA